MVWFGDIKGDNVLHASMSFSIKNGHSNNEPKDRAGAWSGERERFVVVVLLFYVHGKHLRSCWDGQLT